MSDKQHQEPTKSVSPKDAIRAYNHFLASRALLMFAVYGLTSIGF